MFKIRGDIAVIVATVAGVVLLIVAVSKAQEAFNIPSLTKSQTFGISGKARFFERQEQKMYRPKRYVYAQLDDYPASFVIHQKSAALNAAGYEARLDSNAVVRLAIPKKALALLYTRSIIKVYELSAMKGQPFFSFSDATKRDKDERVSLYMQAAICFFGGLVLLIFPKKYLLKE
jgi:hypothetical protein